MKTELLKASYDRYEKYLLWLKRQPLAEQTRRAYRSRTNHFLGFLGTSGEDIRALVQNERERTHVLREYKRHLKQDLKSRPATVNAYLTAIEHFLQFLGASAVQVAREDLPQEGPRHYRRTSKNASFAQSQRAAGVKTERSLFCLSTPACALVSALHLMNTTFQ